MALILLVDDDPAICRLMRHCLIDEHRVVVIDNGLDAVRAVRELKPQMVLLNLDMPGMDGFETCRRIKALPAHLVPIVTIVSFHSTASELTAAIAAGADDYMVKPVDRFELLSRVRLHTRLRDAMTSMQQMSETVQSILSVSRNLSKDVSDMQDIAAFMLRKMAETRDNETGAHIVRMRDYSMLLARELRRESPYQNQIDDRFLDQLNRACPLHDIGKIGIPDSILLKPGRLTTEERSVMEQHTIIGAEVLAQAANQSPVGGFLTMAVHVARSHHERWDGTGYPDGLSGLNIPLVARIVAEADVYDALTSERPYKAAWPVDEARREILRQTGRQFDPVVVLAFERCFDDFVNLPVNKSSTMVLASDTSHASVSATPVACDAAGRGRVSVLAI